MVKPTNKQIKCIIDNYIIENYGTSRIYKETGEYPELNPNRRPIRHLTEKEKNIIEDNKQ